MTTEIIPIFLLSMPRGGSTLLQRILGAHDEVATAAETWLMLPQIYAFRAEGITADYAQSALSVALNDFCLALPDGMADYQAALRQFTLGLYRKAAGEGPRYFLDKTPRYSLIASDLIPIFPKGKFVFLWRHPLSVAASLVNTFMRKWWRYRRLRVDMFDGQAGLIDAYRHYGDRGIAIRYEDLVIDPSPHVQRLMEYLELPFDPEMLTGFANVKFQGRMTGDPTGQEAYDQIDRRPLEKWKLSFANPIRKRWGRRYLKWLGADRLSVMGYDLDELLADLANCPNGLSRLGGDAYYRVRDFLLPRELELWGRRIKRGLFSRPDKADNGKADAATIQAGRR